MNQEFYILFVKCNQQELNLKNHKLKSNKAICLRGGWLNLTYTVHSMHWYVPHSLKSLVCGVVFIVKNKVISRCTWKTCTKFQISLNLLCLFKTPYFLSNTDAFRCIRQHPLSHVISYRIRTRNRVWASLFLSRNQCVTLSDFKRKDISKKEEKRHKPTKHEMGVFFNLC